MKCPPETLRRKLEGIINSNVISKYEVTRIEEMVGTNFITERIPYEKFTDVNSNINWYETVRIIKEFLANHKQEQLMTVKELMEQLKHTIRTLESYLDHIRKYKEKYEIFGRNALQFTSGVNTSRIVLNGLSCYTNEAPAVAVFKFDYFCADLLRQLEISDEHLFSIYIRENIEDSDEKDIPGVGYSDTDVTDRILPFYNLLVYPDEIMHVTSYSELMHEFASGLSKIEKGLLSHLEFLNNSYNIYKLQFPSEEVVGLDNNMFSNLTTIKQAEANDLLLSWFKICIVHNLK